MLFVDYYRFSDTYTCWPNSGEPHCEGGLLRSIVHAKGVTRERGKGKQRQSLLCPTIQLKVPQLLKQHGVRES